MVVGAKRSTTIMDKLKWFIFSFLIAAYIFSPVIPLYANGGDQRIVEGKYFVNLARAPFTPRVGSKTAMLISFADIQKRTLIREDIIVSIRIAKLGEIERGKRLFIFEEEDIPVIGGVFEFPYTFMEEGLHEIFINFAFARDSERVYEAPDFLLDVQPSSEAQNDFPVFLLAGAIGFAIGFIVRWITGKGQLQV